MIKLFVVFLIFFPCSALACRCAPKSLASAFEQADYVFLAEVDERRSDQEVLLHFEFMGSAFKGDPTEIKKLTTPENSAACGITVPKQEPYLLFASRREDTTGEAVVTLCDGTRPFSPSGANPHSGFPDADSPQVLRTLHNLKTTHEMLEEGIGGRALPNSIVGMLYSSDGQKSFTLRSSPRNDAPVAHDDVTLEDLQTEEIGYEQEAALVFHRLPGWSQVKTLEGAPAWTADTKQSEYYPLEALLAKRLTYLTREWPGFLWPEPGAGIPVRAAEQKRERPAVVVDSTRVADSLWLKVKIYREDPCQGGSSEKFTHGGWIPAWNAEGKRTVWFYSRGC